MLRLRIDFPVTTLLDVFTFSVQLVSERIVRFGCNGSTTAELPLQMVGIWVQQASIAEVEEDYGTQECASCPYSYH